MVRAAVACRWSVTAPVLTVTGVAVAERADCCQAWRVLEEVRSARDQRTAGCPSTYYSNLFPTMIDSIARPPRCCAQNPNPPARSRVATDWVAAAAATATSAAGCRRAY